MSRSAEALVEQLTEELRDAAQHHGHADGQAALDFESPSPTPGEAELLALKQQADHRLDDSLRRDRASISTRRDEIDRILAAHRSGEPVTPPTAAPRVFPIEWLVLGLLVVVETVTLRHPLTVVLGMTDGAWEPLALALFVSVVVAAVGEIRARSVIDAADAFGAERDRLERRARLLTASIVVLGCIAGASRLYTGLLEAEGNRSSIDATGYAVFFGLQLAFAVANLILPVSYARRVAEANATHRQRWIDQLRTEHTELRDELDRFDQTARSLRGLLDRATWGALVHYRTTLCAEHPDPGARARWADRTAHELRTGVHDQLACNRYLELGPLPTVPPAPTAPVNVPGDDPGGADTPGGPEPADGDQPGPRRPRPVDGDGPDDDALHQEPSGPSPRPDDDDPDVDDLFAAILGR